MTVHHPLARVAWQLVAVASALALALALVPATASAQNNNDDDFDVCDEVEGETDYADRDEVRDAHRERVDCILALGISLGADTDDDGDTLYDPLSEVTRGQMATFVVNLLTGAGIELPDGSGAPEFTDTEGNPHEGNIDRIAEAGIVSGFGDETFRPTEDILRQQMATYMVAAAEYALDEFFPDDAPHDLTSDQQHFADVTPDNQHYGNINGGFELSPQLFRGTTEPTAGTPTGEFSPAEPVLRDQMATFLINLLNYVAANAPEMPEPADITVEATDEFVEVNSSATVTATVVDEDDQPVADWSVFFETDEGGEPQEGQAETNEDGHAFFEFTSDEPGEVDVTGTVTDTAGEEFSDSDTVTFTPVGVPDPFAPEDIELEADSPVEVDQTSNVTATVTDFFGGGVDGELVEFDVDAPGTPPEGEDVTNDDGEAYFAFSSPEEGELTVTGTATDDDGEELVATATVTVGDEPGDTELESAEFYDAGEGDTFGDDEDDTLVLGFSGELDPDTADDAVVTTTDDGAENGYVVECSDEAITCEVGAFDDGSFNPLPEDGNDTLLVTVNNADEVDNLDNVTDQQVTDVEGLLDANGNPVVVAEPVDIVAGEEGLLPFL